MTEAYIISGFLGSGKTTLIKTIINTAFKGKKIAVIENDFGEARIDASLLEKYDLKVNSLTEGCICCSLAGDLKKNSGNATVQLCSRSAADRTFRCRKTFRHIKIMFFAGRSGKAPVAADDHNGRCALF